VKLVQRGFKRPFSEAVSRKFATGEWRRSGCC